MSFRSGPGVIDFDADGSLTRVEHDRRPGWPALTGGGRPTAIVDGRAMEWAGPEVLADADEVEFGYLGGSIRVTVRHSFAVGWGVRVAVTNLGDEAVALDELGLTWTAADDAPVWVLAAGAVGTYVVPTPDSTGPVLLGTLDLGTVERIDADGFGFGPVALAPQGRFVVQWSWDWGRRSAARRARSQIPSTRRLEVDQVITIAADDDTAVLTPSGVAVEQRQGLTELSCWEPGVFTVELRSAGGGVHFELCAAEPLDGLVAATLEVLFRDAPLTSAGIVALPDVHAALVVQYGLIRGSVPDRDQAEESLDLFLARHLDLEIADPRLIIFAAREATRTGAADVVDVATDWVAAHDTFVPGLGLALPEVLLAGMVTGARHVPTPDRVAGLPVDGAIATQIASVPALGAATELEQIQLAATDAGRRMAAVVALGGWLGAGGKGDPLRPLDPAHEAYLTAVFRLVGEDLGEPLRRRWGVTAAEVARRREVGVRHALAAAGRRWRASPGSALSWLLVGSGTTLD